MEDEEDPKPLFVTDSGDLEVPYIGRVPAENKTCRQLAAEIKASLEKRYYYQATVMIAVDVMAKSQKSQGRVYLVGAVRLPGPVEIPNDEVFTLGKAILRAGGFTDYADRRHVKVTRKDTTGKDVAAGDVVVKDTATNNAAGKNAAVKDDIKSFTVDVGKIFDKGDIESDLPGSIGTQIVLRPAPFQTGSMQRSSSEFRKACELVRNGRIGKVQKVIVDVGGPSVPCDLPEEAMEPGLNWDLWLGPAPLRPTTRSSARAACISTSPTGGTIANTRAAA